MIKYFSPLYILFFLSLIFLAGCSSSRYTAKKYNYKPSKSIPVRALLFEGKRKLFYKVESTVILLNENKPAALIKEGNKLMFSADGNLLTLNISGKIFNGKYFELKPQNKDEFVFYNGKKYYGFLKFTSDGENINVINKVSLDDYLKGVVPAEMPAGNNSYFQALKAFAICARTYALMKLNEDQSYYDVYIDTRDQVYGGADVETELSDKAIDETRNLILTYDGKPAKVFYHACCGGHTANAKNVFGINNAPYLEGVQDGDPPNCSIAPNFSWEEYYPAGVFVDRLRDAGLISSKDYKLKSINVESRFKSGRVDVLSIKLSSANNDIKTVKLTGNEIRTVIRTADNSAILKSTLFKIHVENNGDVVINGRGNGHGVGLCQWGAIHQSTEGKNYKQILSFYFPGTVIKELK